MLERRGVSLSEILDALCEAARRATDARAGAIIRFSQGHTACLACSGEGGRLLDVLADAERVAKGATGGGLVLVQLGGGNGAATVLVLDSPARDGALAPLGRLGRSILAQLDSAGSPEEARLAMVRHQLKTPLVAMKGYLDMVRRGMAGPITPVMDRYLERVAAGIERARALVDSELQATAPRNADRYTVGG
ncbi:MAG: hypothetical protein HYZ28_08305 [Myxococcales bacterium]|nr:hypothetical protein [Myxococcales bacterium]